MGDLDDRGRGFRLRVAPKPPVSLNSSATAAMLLRMPTVLTASAQRPRRVALRASLAASSRWDRSDRATATEPSRQLKQRQVMSDMPR